MRHGSRQRGTHDVSGTCSQTETIPPWFHCVHSSAWRRRQYGNYSALMHFSSPTWSTVSRGSRSPEIGLMRIMSAYRSLKSERREKIEILPVSLEHMGNAFQARISVQVRTSALPAKFPFTSGESLTSRFLVTLQFSLARRTYILCIRHNHYYYYYYYYDD